MPRERTGRRSRRSDPEANVSSFSDIAFLLIIFFILVTTLQQLMGLTTDFPSGDEATAEASETFRVLLAPDRMVLVVGEAETALSMAELRQRLREADFPSRGEGEKVVELEAQGGVRYQRYFEVLTAIVDAGAQPGIVREDDQ